jgi:hypothetical protein
VELLFSCAEFSKAELGYPYGVRADFLSDSPENASSASAWQHVMIEK